MGEPTQAATKPKEWTSVISSIAIVAADLHRDRTAADVVVDETSCVVMVINRRCRCRCGKDRGFDPIDRRYFGIMEITVGYWITSCLLLLHVWGSMVFCWKATAFGLTKYDLS